MKKKSVTTKSTNQTVQFGTTAQAKPVESVKEEVKDTVKAAETKISEKVDDAATKASETVTGATTKVEEKVSDVVAKAGEKVSDVATKVSEKATDAKTTVKTAAKKTADKVAASTKKAEKEALVPEIYVQYTGREANQKDIIENIKAAYVAEGHRAGSIKTLQVYLKPEENAAYYVINQKYAGSVSLF